MADDHDQSCEPDDLNYRGADDHGRNFEPDVLGDLNYRGAADDLDQNFSPDDAHGRHHEAHAAHGPDQNCEPDEPDDPNYRDAAHGPDQNFSPDDPDDLNYHDVLGDRVDLDDHDDHQHLLDVEGDFPLQKALPDGQYARHGLGADDVQNQGFRRVAWHNDAIAKTTNKD